MNSSKTLNYETRPVKFTERKMLLATIIKLLHHFKTPYQYIGLGGITFTDFKLFHKELHLNEMYSIEGGEFTSEKLNFNNPFSFIKVLSEKSTISLTNGEIDLTKKSFVWLDYDECLENFVFEDITALFSKLPAGSIYLFTCNRQLDNKKHNVPYSVEDFKEKFGSYTPFDLTASELSRKTSFKGIRKAVKLHLETVLKQRSNSEGIEYNFHQLYNILYNENRGAEMFTYGGVMTNESDNVDDLDFSEFEFIKLDEEPYEIILPNFTRKEIDLVNSYLHEKEQELIDLKIVEEKEVADYKSIYKYMPQFLDVRM